MSRSSRQVAAMIGSGLGGVTLVLPPAPAAVHGDHIRVSHLLNRIGREGAAEAAAAVKDDRRRVIRDLLFDIPLDDTFADMLGLWQVAGCVLAFLADVDDLELLALIDPLLDVCDLAFFHARFGVGDDREKAGGVLLGHEKSLSL